MLEQGRQVDATEMGQRDDGPHLGFRGQLGVGPGTAYVQFVNSAFEECFFSQNQLEREVDQAIATFLNQMRRIDEQTGARLGLKHTSTALRLQRPLETSGTAKPMIEKAASGVRDAIIRAIRDELLRVSMATILGEILTQATVRIGVSAGVWNLGAATAPLTYGGSFAAAYVVDEILGHAWNAWSDPAGSLGRAVDSKLEQLHQAILDGTSKTVGLRARWIGIEQEYQRRRRAAVKNLPPTPANGLKR